MISALKTLTFTNNIVSKRCVFLMNQNRLFRNTSVIQTLSKDLTNETYEEKNIRLKRPLSPHLNIYKVQITSVLSILHRISGVVLVGYGLFIGSFALWDVQKFILFIQDLQLPSVLLYAFKTLLTIPLSYHVSNGVRHLIWDSGFFLTNKGVNITGYATLLSTVLLSLYFATR